MAGRVYVDSRWALPVAPQTLCSKERHMTRRGATGRAGAPLSSSRADTGGDLGEMFPDGVAQESEIWKKELRN